MAIEADHLDDLGKRGIPTDQKTVGRGRFGGYQASKWLSRTFWRENEPWQNNEITLNQQND